MRRFKMLEGGAGLMLTSLWRVSDGNGWKG